MAFWLVHLFRTSSIEMKKYFCNALINRITSKMENNIEVSLILFEISRNDQDVLVYFIKNNLLGRMFSSISREKEKVF